jgi:hypothetical protein
VSQDAFEIEVSQNGFQTLWHIACLKTVSRHRVSQDAFKIQVSRNGFQTLWRIACLKTVSKRRCLKTHLKSRCLETVSRRFGDCVSQNCFQTPSVSRRFWNPGVSKRFPDALGIRCLKTVSKCRCLKTVSRRFGVSGQEILNRIFWMEDENLYFRETLDSWKWYMMECYCVSNHENGGESEFCTNLVKKIGCGCWTCVLCLELFGRDVNSV